METSKTLTPAELANVLLREMKSSRLKQLDRFESGEACPDATPEIRATVIADLRSELVAIEHLETCLGSSIDELVRRGDLPHHGHAEGELS